MIVRIVCEDLKKVNALKAKFPDLSPSTLHCMSDFSFDLPESAGQELITFCKTQSMTHYVI